MLYVQLDVNWVDHPKIMDVGLDGAGLHAAALCMAKRMETDGVLHRTHLRRLGADDELIDRLVAAGLFDALDDTRIEVHGWLDRNPSQAAIAATRSAKSGSGREGNHARWGHSGPVELCPKCNPPEPSAERLNGQVNPRSSQGASPRSRSGFSETSGCDESESPETETETETETTQNTRAPAVSTALVPARPRSSPPVTDTYTDEFEKWWTLYPRKAAKAAAAKAFKAARRATDLDTLTRTLSAQSAMWRDQGRASEHIPHAASWLNGRRWEDVPDRPKGPSRPRSWDAIERVTGEQLRSQP